MAYSVKKKEFYAYIYRKYPRTCPSTKTKGTKFFLFAVVFLFFSFCSFFSLFFFFLVLYTMAFLPFPHSTCGSGVESPFFLLLVPFLESSILSCKAACSMFRHHLHINAIRGLARQHLMRRQQYPQIFVFSHSYPLFDIFSFVLLPGLSEALP